LCITEAIPTKCGLPPPHSLRPSHTVIRERVPATGAAAERTCTAIRQRAAAGIGRWLIDASASPVRAQPRVLRNLMIAARKSWLMAYDNITTLPAWLSNGLFVRADTDEQNRSVLIIESIPKTCMTSTSKHGLRRSRGAGRRSHGAGRRSHGAEPHFEPSMQAI
jgi:hypothetical protein